MPERTCSIDKDPRKNDWVARRHLEGHSFSAMEKLAKAEGLTMKRETIARHIKECVGANYSPQEMKAAAEKVAAKSIVNIDNDEGPEDVAVLVQRQVVQKLKDGEARVTVQHGLQAQQLLDRRAERAKDRELAITLARLLHSPAPTEDAIRHRQLDAGSGEEVIEGTAVEVG